MTDEDDENECGCSERAPAGEYWRCPDCDAEWFPEEPDPTMPPEMPEKCDRILHGAGRLMDNPEYRRATWAAIREALMKEGRGAR